MKLEKNQSSATPATSNFSVNSNHHGIWISDTEAEETGETGKEQVLETWCPGSDSL
jgi:hypothetical protein